MWISRFCSISGTFTKPFLPSCVFLYSLFFPRVQTNSFLPLFLYPVPGKLQLVHLPLITQTNAFQEATLALEKLWGRENKGKPLSWSFREAPNRQKTKGKYNYNSLRIKSVFITLSGTRNYIRGMWAAIFMATTEVGSGRLWMGKVKYHMFFQKFSSFLKKWGIVDI